MKGVIRVEYPSDIDQVTRQARDIFFKNLLKQIGIPINDIWSSDESMTVEEKIKVRDLLIKYKIQVSSTKEDMMIYIENKKVAQWNKPFFILKKDLSQIDEKKQLFLEMHTEYWSIFESI